MNFESMNRATQNNDELLDRFTKLASNHLHLLGMDTLGNICLPYYSILMSYIETYMIIIQMEALGHVLQQARAFKDLEKSSSF